MDMRRTSFLTLESLFDVILVAIVALSVLFILQAASPTAVVAALPAAAHAQPAAAGAADPQQYPVMDAIANKIIQKYQGSTCEQLWQEKAQAKNKPKSQQEQEAIGILRNDAQMRAAFINKIAAPVANKMFECGMIP
jgi:biopolymer transport protein ExbD